MLVSGRRIPWLGDLFSGTLRESGEENIIRREIWERVIARRLKNVGEIFHEL